MAGNLIALNRAVVVPQHKAGGAKGTTARAETLDGAVVEHHAIEILAEGEHVRRMRRQRSDRHERRFEVEQADEGNERHLFGGVAAGKVAHLIDGQPRVLPQQVRVVCEARPNLQLLGSVGAVAQDGGGQHVENVVAVHRA